MDTIVSESRITLDARFLCQNIIVLSLEVADDLGKAMAGQLYSSL